jgi:hypothetical protein
MLVTDGGSSCNDAQHLYLVHADENVVLFHYCNGNNNELTLPKVQLFCSIYHHKKYEPAKYRSSNCAF